LAVGMKPSLVDASVKKKGDAGDDEVLTQVGPELGIHILLMRSKSGSRS